MAKDIIVALELDNKQYNQALKDSQSQTTAFTTSGISGAKALAGAFAAIGGAAVIQNIVNVGSKFQDLNNALRVVFGSAQAGAVQFERIQQFAAGTQFSVQTLTQAFIQLKGAGIEPTDELLQTFADTASVTTDQMGTFQAALDLVSRSTAGGLGLEDLNRLADRGVPVFAILQEKLNLTRLELSEFGRTAQGAQQIIDALTEGLQERFGGALEDSAGNISRLTNNLGDSFDKLSNAVFKLVEPAIQEGLVKLTETIERLATGIENLENNGAKLKTLVVSLGTALLFILNPISKVTAAFGWLSRTLVGIYRGTGVLGSLLRGLTTNISNFAAVVKSMTKDFLGFGTGVVKNSEALSGMASAARLLYTAITAAASGIAGYLGLSALFNDETEESIENIDGMTGAMQRNAEAQAEFERRQAEAARRAQELSNRIAELTAKAREFTEVDYRTELEKLTDAQKEAQQAIDDLVTAYGLSNGQLEDYEILMTAARNALAAANKELADYNENLRNQNLTDYEKYIKSLTQQMIDYAKEQEHARMALAFFNQLFEDEKLTVEAYTFVVEKLNGVLGKTTGATEAQRKSFEQFKAGVDVLWKSTDNYALMLENLTNLQATGKISADQLAEGIVYLNEKFSENEALNNFLDTLGKAQKALSQDLADAFLEGESAGEAFQNFFKKMVKQIIADIIRLQIIQPILGALLAPFGFGFGVGGSVIKLPGLADGGPATAGKPYIVGEEGPELFVPKTSGTVIPNGESTGGGTINNTYITNQISAVDAKSVAQLFTENRKTLLGTVQMAQKEMPYAM